MGGLKWEVLISLINWSFRNERGSSKSAGAARARERQERGSGKSAGAVRGRKGREGGTGESTAMAKERGW